MMVLRPDFRQALGEREDAFEAILNTPGQIMRQMNGRRTLRFTLDDRSYYLKAHFGIGWREIVKNLVQLRLPVLGARNEWRAIQRLVALGIDTTPLVGFGQTGRNPARQRSFVITEELQDITSLEDLCASWRHAPPRTGDALRFKRALIREVARIARTLHGNGMNHRDFYLCHFCLHQPPRHPEVFQQDRPRLYLLDLHRVQIRRHTPRRWLIKDLGSLYFSAMDAGLTRGDRLRFIRHYRGGALRAALTEEGQFWEAVRERARQLYRPFHHREPPPGC
jgi:heptose I phosphotransferase